MNDKQRKRQPESITDGSIDAGLILLAEISPPGKQWSQAEIAEACGCSRGQIWSIESRALAKLRKRLERLRHEGRI
ncbi:MAG: hypothetical protein V7638_3912 [Acidobacteriota bacterium]